MIDVAWEGGASEHEAMIAWWYNNTDAGIEATVRYNTWTSGAWGTSDDLTLADGDGGDITNKGASLYLSTGWSEEHSSIGIMAATGLTKELDDTRIAAILASGRAAQATTDELLQQALEHGGEDNVTVLLIDILAAP